MNVFGFINLDRTQTKEINYLNLLAFPGTGLLQKILLAKPLDGEHASAIEGTDFVGFFHFLAPLSG
jgi:hypothetical protein